MKNRRIKPVTVAILHTSAGSCLLNLGSFTSGVLLSMAKTSLLLERGCMPLSTETPLFRRRPRAEFSSQRAYGIVRCALDGEEGSLHANSKKNLNVVFPLLNYMAEFENPNRLYRERFVIRSYEVGTGHTASLQTIASLLQEVAFNHMIAGSGLHGRSLGLGFATSSSMRKDRLIWVATRMHIEVEEYPLWGEEVEIQSWFQFEGRIKTTRDWIITKAGGNVVARATSTWTMVNQETRRLSRTNENVRDEYSQYVMQPPRWAFSDHGDSSKKQIPKLDEYEHTKDQLEARRTDLDMNQHVNNVTYISWILESLPIQISNTHELHSITLEFRHECKHDDVVVSKGSRSSSKSNVADSGLQEFTHLVELANSDKEINRASSTWRRRKDYADYKDHCSMTA